MAKTASKKKQAEAEAETPVTPGPLRPEAGATNSKIAGPPPVADQPGLGRAANPTPPPGPRANLDVSRVGSAIKDRQALNQEHAEAAAQG